MEQQIFKNPSKVTNISEPESPPDMETTTARRRVEMITGHFAADNISATLVATHVFPMSCSGGLSSISRRRDNSMHFARQDSRSQGFFMRPGSTQQDCFDRSDMSHESTRSQASPLFSQPASINSNVPKVRNIQHVVSDYELPTSQLPKFSRITKEKVVPMQFSPTNKHTTNYLGVEKKRSPRMEVSESGGKYILLIELPGINVDDIRVEVDNTTLTVQTTKGRTTAYCSSDRASSLYYKREIVREPFEITWPLPFNVNPDSISTELLDGLLCIAITKLRAPVS